MPAACSASVAARTSAQPPGASRGSGAPEHDRIVAPGVGEAERRQMPLVDERVGRHDLDRGDAERGQMRDRRRVGEPGEGPARASGIAGLRREKPRRLSS